MNADNELMLSTNANNITIKEEKDDTIEDNFDFDSSSVFVKEEESMLVTTVMGHSYNETVNNFSYMELIKESFDIPKKKKTNKGLSRNLISSYQIKSKFYNKLINNANNWTVPLVRCDISQISLDNTFNQEDVCDKTNESQLFSSCIPNNTGNKNSDSLNECTDVNNSSNIAKKDCTLKNSMKLTDLKCKQIIERTKFLSIPLVKLNEEILLGLSRTEKFTNGSKLFSLYDSGSKKTTQNIVTQINNYVNLNDEKKSKSFKIKNNYSTQYISHSSSTTISTSTKFYIKNKSVINKSLFKSSINTTELLKYCIKVNSEQKPYQCSICLKTFSQKGNIKSHIITHTNIKPYKCDVCKKSFSLASTLITHKVIHYDKKPYNCDICKKSFTQKHCIRSHMMISHTGENPFKCDVCNKLFSGASILSTHKIIHRNKKPFICAICKKTFAQKGNIKTHMLIHMGDRPYKCNVCNKSFSQHSSLSKHKVIHSDKKPFICDICNKTFALLSSLITHKIIHNAEKPYNCALCSKSFTQKHCIRSHMMTTHNFEKPFKCNICFKSFPIKSTLTLHKIIHTAQKPFVCNICGKTFSQKGNIKTHMTIHTGQKPYTCSVCHKSFTQSTNLKNHAIIHTGKRPFKCNICKKTFTLKLTLKNHKLIHCKVKQ